MNIRTSLLALALSVGAAVFAAPAAFADPVDSHPGMSHDANHDMHAPDHAHYINHSPRHRAYCVRHRHGRCVQWSRNYRR